MGAYQDYGYDYGYDDFGGMFSDPDILAVFGIFIAILAITVLIQWVIGIVWYILRSIGLHKISENRGMSGSALAWIPFVGFYRIGSIADDIAARNGGRTYYRHILLAGGIVSALGGIGSWLLMALSGIFSQIFRGYDYGYGYGYGYDSYHSEYGSLIAYWGFSGLLSLLAVALYVFMLIALYKIYKEYRPDSATLWTVLSAIFPFMQSIFPFVLRNAVPASAWGAQGYYPMQANMPDQNWQAPPPPQYPPYGQQQPVNGGYPVQNQDWQVPPPPSANAYPPPADSYQPPVAPNPPEAWEVEDSVSQPPPQAPWDQNNHDK